MREEELAALADGSLPARRRPALEAELERSPVLRARLDEQRRAIGVTRDAALSVSAPLRLRSGLAARRPARSVRALGRSRGLVAGLAAAAAVAVVAVVLALPGHVPGGPTVADAAALAIRPPTGPGPRVQPGRPTLLAREVDGVPYPNWANRFGWRAVGVRVDTIGGRRATTVFYRKDGRRLGYTIVAGKALHVPAGARRVVSGDTEIRLLRLGGRPVATWERRGHTCVLSGVGPTKLAKLAGWKGNGTVPF